MPEQDAIPPGPEGDLSLALVRRIQGGDRAAWQDLYARYHDALLLTIRCRLGAGLRGRVQSEDILQSVVKDALSELERFEPRGVGSLRRYLHACVVNKIRATASRDVAGARGRARQASTTELDQLPSAAGDALDYFDGERFGRLERAMRALPDAMREVVILRTIEGASNEEAASLLGKTPEATSKLYNRALARLGTSVSPDRLP
jgi:RNA polymerase sigma-70 factor (ECF subfamily)